MSFSPHLIQAFITFCEAKNIESAANSIGITQPALSKQLKLFNDSLPYEVFTFQGKKKVLTPFGKQLYIELQDKYHSLEKSLFSVCNNYGDINNSIVRIAARTEIIERLVGNINHPGRIDFLEYNHDQIIKNVLEGNIDFGITHSLPNSFEIIAKKILKERFHLVSPKSKKKKLDHQTQPVIAYKENDTILKSACRELNLNFDQLNIKRICSNYGLIRNMVNQGIGWAILPTHIKTDEKKCETYELNGKNISTKDFYLIYRKEISQLKWFKEITKDIKDSL